MLTKSADHPASMVIYERVLQSLSHDDKDIPELGIHGRIHS